MRRFRLNRRAVLRGAGAAVALPTLEAMLDSHGTAYAQGAPLPKRFVTFHWGNGVILSRFRPAATGAGWALTEELQPLEAVKDYVNVVSGHQIKIPNDRGHHCGVAGMFSGYPFIVLPANGAPYASKFGGPSVDQVAVDLIAGDTTFKSLQIAVSRRITTGEGPTLRYLSHRGPDQSLPQEFSPANLYATLFGNFTPPDTNDPRNQLRVNVLDAVKDSITRLNGRLGSADRARMDAHLTSITEVRQQILALPPPVGGACVKPAAVTESNTAVNGVDPFEAVATAFSSLLAIAFACDLTRVVSYHFTGSVGHHVYRNLSQDKTNHGLSHWNDPNLGLAPDVAREQIHQGVVFTMRNLATFLNKLRTTVEASGNLLDQSCVLASTDVAEGDPHTISDYPILVCGRGGGFLRYPGVHYRSTTNENTSNVLLSCLRAVAGPTVASAGGEAPGRTGSGRSTTPCSAIHA